MDLVTNKINDIQELCLDIYGRYDIDKSMLWMAEEFGEVIAAIRKGKSKNDICGEIGDLTAWIISICNILNIELSSAIKATIQKEMNRQLRAYGKLKYAQSEEREKLLLDMLHSIENERDKIG